MTHIELLSGAARTYNIRVRMPFRTGKGRFEKYGKINVCFLSGGGSQAFMYETPVINLNCLNRIEEIENVIVEKTI
jgi:hypothetical protein